MRLLVTGGSGFIGRNLLKQVDSSCEVFDFSRSKGHDLRNFKESYDTIREFAPDCIINLASNGGSLHYVSSFAANVIHDNVRMYVNLYEVARLLDKIPFIVNPISNCAYPGNTSIQKEDEWLNGPPHESVHPFANAKRTLYAISRCYAKQYGVKTTNLIFPNAFGVEDSTDPNHTHAMGGMIIRMLKAKRNGDHEFEVWGTGNPVREWIYSEDFAKYLLSSLAMPPLLEPVNIAQGRGYAIKESVEIIKELMGYEGNIVFNTKYKDGDPVKVLDATKFTSIWGDYGFTDHREAIQKTIRYYELCCL
jgi:GDP-L-fucose synthase